MTNERREASLNTPARTVGQAQEIADDVTRRLMAEVVMNDYEGEDVQALVVVVSRAKHPTNALPFAYWISTQDNLDRMAMDTVALSALPQIVAELDMPFDMRLELCRRIMTKEKPLQDQAGYIVGEMGRRAGPDPKGRGRK